MVKYSSSGIELLHSFKRSVTWGTLGNEMSHYSCVILHFRDQGLCGRSKGDFQLHKNSSVHTALVQGYTAFAVLPENNSQPFSFTQQLQKCVNYVKMNSCDLKANVVLLLLVTIGVGASLSDPAD